ncbi:MAG: glycosyltransferase [Gammaproteobacteria bacterium]|nr:glycosyltransferase [Gammaproteobacteria bacterium]
MRVLHVECGRHLYGGPQQVLYLLRGLREATGERQVLACPPGSGLARAARDLADVHELRMGGELDPGLIGRLIRLIGSTAPALVHVHSRRGADWWGGLAARRARVPALISRRVVSPEPAWLARHKYRLYRAVIAISEGIRLVLLRQGLPPERVTTVLSAVDTAAFRPGGDRRWLREAFGFPPEARVLAMIGQFIPKKGHAVLLQALEGLVPAYPELRVLLLGTGHLWERVRADVERRGWADRVRLPGFRDDLPRVLPALDLVVHPAFEEGLGVSLLQSAACGVPVVGSAIGGIPEVVRDGVNGRLVPAGDALSLGRAVRSVLDDPDGARALGAAGRRIVEREFSVPAMVAGNLQVYRDVLESRSRY